jgi:hypothetical protein
MLVQPFAAAPGPLKECDSLYSDMSMCAVIQVEDILNTCFDLLLDKQ